MSDLTTAFKKQYENAFKLAYQQSESVLRPLVRNETQSAEFKFWDFIEATVAVRGRVRKSATPDIESSYLRRGCKTEPLTWAETTGDPDKIRMMTDPTSDLLRNGGASIHRAEDALILEAIWGTALTGKDGGTSVTAATECYKMLSDGTIANPGTAVTNVTETGLTIAKIGALGRLLDDNKVPATDRWIVANTHQKWYLLGSAKATSYDYAAVKALVDGQFGSYLGFNFKWLPSDSFVTDTTDTGSLRCACFQRDAMLYSVSRDLTTHVDKLPEQNYDTQAFAELFSGAVRLQPNGVIPLLLDADIACDFGQS
jgi:hypothetical protein